VSSARNCLRCYEEGNGQIVVYICLLNVYYVPFRVFYLTTFSVAKIFSVDDGRKNEYEAPLEGVGRGMSNCWWEPILVPFCPPPFHMNWPGTETFFFFTVRVR